MRVADLSRSAAFRRAIERVERGDPPRAVLVSTLTAAQPVLRRAHEDPLVVAAFATVLDPPKRGRSRMSLVAAAAEALDAHADALGRSDLGELAQLAVLDALLAEAGVRHALGRFLARLALTLLARELPAHVGEGHRFPSVEAHARFVEALAAEALAIAGTLEIEVGSSPEALVRASLAALPSEEAA
ncbi:MAG: hypothetical protein ACXVEF_41230 [Polyangiales bacterium]